MEKPVKRSYHAPLRKKQADLTRAQIIASAAKIFGSKGYVNTRIEDVALDAGVAVPTIYRTFKTKSALLLATVQSIMSETDSGTPIEEQPWWQEQIAAPDPKLQLELIARNARAIYERAGALLEVVRAASFVDGAAKQIWHTIDQERRRRAQMTAESLRAKGGLRSDPTIQSVTDTLHLVSAPELYTLFLYRPGATPRDYETWLARVLTHALLP